MKNLFTLIALIFWVFLISQQSLSLSYEGGNIGLNDTVVVFGDSGVYTTMVVYIYVTNQTNQGLSVKVKKAEIQVVPGSENTFCWGQCYIPTVYVSPDPVVIPAQTTDDHSFWGEYKPMGNLGTSILRYTFFVSDNPSDSVSVYVKYTVTPVGITDPAIKSPELILDHSTQWLYLVDNNKEKSEIVFYTVTGQKMGVFSTEMFPLFVGNWPQGVYFYSFNGNLSQAYKLFIIK